MKDNNLKQMILIPLSILCLIFILSQSLFLYLKYSDNNDRLDDFLQFGLVEQLPLYASELYFQRHKAVKSRSDQFLNSIKQSYPETDLCLKIFSNKEIIYKNCQDEITLPNVLKKNVSLGDVDLGKIQLNYGTHYSIPIQYGVSGILSLFLSIIAAFITFKKIEGPLKKQIIAPLLAEVESNIHLKAVNQIASQVAHDIRSPLAALDMITSDIDSLPEDERLIIKSATRRISDIADNLLSSNNISKDKDNLLETQMTSGIIAPILAEKRTEYSAHRNLTIEANFNKDNYGLFIMVNPNDFKRVISNLINNSAEALSYEGSVTITPLLKKDNVLISIEDNGPGIPQHILSKLMQKGVTFGKKEGNGLGLFHAKESLKKWGGDITIDSQLGRGTKVTLSLPKSSAPAWFLPSLNISCDETIVALDDDNSIHKVWENIFNRHHLIEIKHFKTHYQLKTWYATNLIKDNTTFLIDYEILGYEASGLDLIEELGISSKSTLVTSRYEDEDIQKRCTTMGVSLLPKNLAIFVDINVKT